MHKYFYNMCYKILCKACSIEIADYAGLCQINLKKTIFLVSHYDTCKKYVLLIFKLHHITEI